MTISRKYWTWSALSIALLVAGCAPSQRGPASQHDAGKMAAPKVAAPENTGAAPQMEGPAVTPSHSSDMPRKVLLGTVLPGDWVFSAPLNARLDKMDDLMVSIAVEAARKYPGKPLDLAVLPEVFLGRPGKALADQAVRLEDVRERVGACAKKHGCYMIVPMLLQESQTPAVVSNAAVLYDRQGAVVGIYRKVPPIALEEGTTPGGEFPVFDCDFGRLGIQICWDMVHEDGWEALARQGAEIVALPSASPQRAYPAAHALRHHYYVINAAPGLNANVLNPVGMVEAEVAAPGEVLVHEIDLAYALLHWWPKLEEGRGLSERFGDRVGYHYYSREDTGIFWSNDPAMTIDQMMESMGVIEADCQIEQSRVLQDKARGGPPAKPLQR